MDLVLVAIGSVILGWVGREITLRPYARFIDGGATMIRHLAASAGVSPEAWVDRALNMMSHYWRRKKDGWSFYCERDGVREEI